MPRNSKTSNPPSSTGCIAIIIIVLLFSEACKSQDSSPDPVGPLVAGGEPASRGRFPYMCSIRKRGTGRHVCGGTLIDKRWVMTAAHCLDPGNPDSAGMSPFVFCGIYEREEKDVSKRFTPSRCYLHHLWGGNVRNGDDIALCQLETSASIDIPDLANFGDDFTKFDEFSVLGWGQTSSRGSLADNLQIGEGLRYVLPSTCNEVEGWAGDITSSMMCAGFASPNTCRGDSGGPLFIRHDPSAANIPEDPLLDLIVGITSFGFTSCEAYAPGVYTRVSCYRPWINCIMEETEQDCSVYSPCGEDSASPSAEDSSLCSGIQKSSTFDESDALTVSAYDFESVKKTLCDGLSSNAVYGTNNDSLLIRAAQYNAVESAKVLLEHGSQIEYKNNYGQAALSRAAQYGSADVVKLLIDRGADVETKSNSGWTPLAYAASFNQLEAAQILLENGAKLEDKNNDGFAPLHHAAAYNFREVATLLLKYGVDIESKTIMEDTPLHVAAQQNSFDVAKLLIENGADIESKNDAGFTPLHGAAEFNSIEVAEELIANGADIEAENSFGVSPLHIASHFGSLSLVRLLLDENVMVDFVDNFGRSALYRAAARGLISVVRVLLNNGASKTLTSNAGDTPFDVICDESIVEEPCNASVIRTLRQLLEP